MLNRIGVSCLALSLTALVAASFGSAPRSPVDEAPGITEKLLRLRATASRQPPRPGLVAEQVAEIFPELVRRDALGQPRSIRYRLLTSILLDDLQRLSLRVEKLEQAAAGERPTEPLVRIKVEHD